MTFIIYSMILLILIVFFVGWNRSMNTKSGSERQLRAQLLGLCLGDKQLAGRLVMRELRRTPGISSEQALKAAIRSLQRDS